MGFFNGLKNALTAGAKAVSTEVAAKYNGNKDFLEAVCAASALVAAADGDIEDSEVKAIAETLAQNASISMAFSTVEIRTCAENMLAKAKSFSGRQALYRELQDVVGKGSIAEDAYLVAVDIAHADGEVEKKEEEVLAKIAKTLGIDPSKFL